MHLQHAVTYHVAENTRKAQSVVLETLYQEHYKETTLHQERSRKNVRPSQKMTDGRIYKMGLGLATKTDGTEGGEGREEDEANYVQQLCCWTLYVTHGVKPGTSRY